MRATFTSEAEGINPNKRATDTVEFVVPNKNWSTFREWAARIPVEGCRVVLLGDDVHPGKGLRHAVVHRPVGEHVAVGPRVVGALPRLPL